jgi:FkbM family methyltransferase
MHEATVFARSIARRTGLLGLAKFVKSMLVGPGGYEDKFSAEFLATVRPEDVVWDVGANLGLYTAKLLDRVGASGRVVAFEPAPECFAQLQQRFTGEARVRLENLALGNSEGAVMFLVDADPLSDIHRVLDSRSPGRDSLAGDRLIEVKVMSAKHYCALGGLAPQVVKVDVEGYEEEVLNGFGDLLKSEDLRALFLEVHFRLLEARGARMAPVRIERQLHMAGYRTRWIDPSHLRADRQ